MQRSGYIEVKISILSVPNYQSLMTEEERGRVKKEGCIPSSTDSEGCLLISVFTGTAWSFLLKKAHYHLACEGLC